MGRKFLGPSHAFGWDESRFVVVPAPFDATASYGAGARFGPERILEASEQLELFDEELLTEPWKAGIFTEEPLDLPVVPEKVQDVIRGAVGKVLSLEKTPILLGGDHSVTIGAVQAVHNRFGSIDIIYLDAHADLRDEYQGTGLSHACVTRRIWKFGKVIQAGIRSLSREEWQFLEGEGRRPVFAREIVDDLDEAIERILAMLSGRPVYVTIDLDCLDPSVMPATGTPEPGGLEWHQLTRILRAVAGNAEIVGFDVVELAPVPGLHHPDFTAARLVYKMIGYMTD